MEVHQQHINMRTECQQIQVPKKLDITCKMCEMGSWALGVEGQYFQPCSCHMICFMKNDFVTLIKLIIFVAQVT